MNLLQNFKGAVSFSLASAILIVILLSASFLYVGKGLEVTRPRISPLYDITRGNIEFQKLAVDIERMKSGPAVAEIASRVIVKLDIVLSRLDHHARLYQEYGESFQTEIQTDITNIISRLEAIRTEILALESQDNTQNALAGIEERNSAAATLLDKLTQKIYEEEFVRRGIAEVESAKTRRLILGLTFLSILLGTFVALRLWKQRNDMVLDHGQLRELLAQHEKELLRTQRMEAMGQMTVGVAHDFNNLLAIILSNTELAQITDNQQKRDKNIKSVIDAVDYGKRLTNQLLVFGGRSELEPQTIDLNSLISGLGTLIRRTLPENISLSSELAEGLWKIKADRALVEASLMNLVINAYEQLNSGGKVTIASANVRLDNNHVLNERIDLSPGPYVMVSVSDTGEGIPVELHERIFEPFYSTKDRGTGLGLSTTFGFVRKSRGDIKVYSEPGEGTTFKLYFPKVEVEESLQAETIEENLIESTDTNYAILIVEDNKTLRESIISQVLSLGYRCKGVADAKQALEVLSANEKYDLVITDLIMPGEIQGAMLASMIQQDYPDVRVIVMSGYPNDTTKIGDGKLGDITKIMKPISMTTLSLTITHELKRKQY